MYSGQPTKRTTNVRSQRSLPDRIVITNAETVFGRPFVISCSIPVRRLSDIGKGGIGNPSRDHPRKRVHLLSDDVCHHYAGTDRWRVC